MCKVRKNASIHTLQLIKVSFPQIRILQRLRYAAVLRRRSIDNAPRMV